MANSAVINAVGLTSRAFRAVRGGKSAFAAALEFARGLPDVDRVVLLTDSASSDAVRGAGAEVRVLSDWTIRALIAELGAASSGREDVFYLFGDCPLLDAEIARRMYRNHRAYFAEYSFADGYPLGLTPEIIQTGAIPRIARLLRDDDGKIERDTLFTLIQRDVNSFDIETEISPKDLRLLRLSLSCDTERNFRIVKALIDAGCSDEGSLLEIIPKRGDLLRSLPAYFEVQITDGVSQEVSYSPYPLLFGHASQRRGEMALARFEKLASDIAQFADDAVISPSLWGEPALHSSIDAIAAAVRDRPGLELLLETSGIGWREGVLERIAESGSDRITWIVDLDASNPELYRRLRGEGWETAQATTEKLLKLFPGRVHVQAVRMHSNEGDLEAFYKYWKERIPNVIIQKYDWYCGVLPQLKVTDLSPLKRSPCWHLKRDMVILIDGTVPLCREDLKCEHPQGNVFEEGLADVWARGQEYHLQHVREEYPPLCRGCDEYYTYNF